MESINNIINLIKPNVYITSIDLKDAFFSIPIHNDHQKYLKFIFGNLFQFTSMPNGYELVMRIFTKISKVPGHLRSQGYNSVVYEADSYLQRDTYQFCLTNILDTVNLLRELGFLIHSDKLLLAPSQTILFFFRFIISSNHVTLSATDEKKNKIKTFLTNCVHSH